MSYHRLGQFLNGVPVDVSRCFPQLKAEAEAAATEINRVIDAYPWATQELAQRFQKVMDDAKRAGLCPFVKGTGPLIEESHKVLEAARSLAANPPPAPQLTPQQVQTVLMESPGASLPPLPSMPSMPSASITSPTMSLPSASVSAEPSRAGVGLLVVFGLLGLVGASIYFICKKKEEEETPASRKKRRRKKH